MLRRLLRSALAGSRATGWNERGLALARRGDCAGAERAFREALRLNERHAAACSNLGLALEGQRRYDEALAMLRRAADLDPRHAGVRVNLANALHRGGLLDEALEHYREAVRIDPYRPEARANLLKPLLDACLWDESRAEVDRLLELWRAGGGWEEQVTPYLALLLPFPAAFQLHVARHHSSLLERAVETMPRPVRGGGVHARIRVGYVSCDFHDHATAHLCADLFGRQDRKRFEIHAYSFGPDDGSEWRARVAAGTDHFVDVSAESFSGTAQRIARDGIDILVDLKGYTGDSRPEIFALRPAPLQVSYLGYPGTMGARFIDYLIADATVAPPGDRGDFSEALAWMPDCYQPNDAPWRGEPPVPPRAAAGLPEDAFVFCAFNALYKIDAQAFAAWLRILRAVPGSVLWLIEGPPSTMERLRARARAAGVAPGRLVFAARKPRREHVARHRLGGLFLDTHVCNAHTTASDALRAEVPIVTLPGSTFPSRVAASLVRTAGLPELIARDWTHYEELAVDLARDPARLAEVKARLAASVRGGPLFDPRRYAAHLDGLFAAMWSRHLAGAAPAALRDG